MLKTFKGRGVYANQTVEVYYDLHRKCFSVRDKKTKLVIAKGNDFMVKNAVFVVQEKGQEKARKTKVRNVHAFIEGEFVKTTDEHTYYEEDKIAKIHYNPFEDEGFKVGGEVIEKAKVVVFSSKHGCFV